ncbi:hypothetical protein BDM02DRAFT_3110142 [Thelephora ganbajun]|uniref:Uncharacterized protein n=1 Tax=Thelephora ganbajun TaxID=370292 RepID=A0ACB6ZQA7_THEGA|nr:hypothetical protein BDM02DRAFT_3110142 [Thelephora ganbajun]
MPSKRWGWSIYKDQMSQLGHGDALWEPAPIHSFKRVRLGDVGYVRRGRFHLLFSAGRPLDNRQLGVDVPLTFVPLNIGPTICSQPRLPGYLSPCTAQEVRAGREALVDAFPVLEPGYKVSFNLTDNQGAALVTKHRTYREDLELESTLKKYTKRHYNSWVQFARDAGHGDDIKPVLVTGVDLTSDFAMMAYSSDSVGLKSEFRASDPPVDSASASVWGTWHVEGLVHTNCGPQLCCPPSSTRATNPTISGKKATPDEYNQCVFIRYFMMRKRALVFPTVIRAAAGPHDLGPGGRDDEELVRMETRSDSDSGTGSDIMSWDGHGDDDRNFISGEDAHIVVHETTSAWPSPRLPVYSIHPLGEKEDEFDVWEKRGDFGEWNGGDSDEWDEEGASDTLEGDDEGSDLDKIAEYILQNPNTDSALIHHQDIARLRELGNTTDVSTLLSEKRPPITVDADRVGMIEWQRYPLSRLSDYRMQLNNLLQANGGTGRLRWGDPINKGPDQCRPHWTINAFLDGMECGRGDGANLGQAKEEAARQVLMHFSSLNFTC